MMTFAPSTLQDINLDHPIVTRSGYNKLIVFFCKLQWNPLSNHDTYSVFFGIK